MSSLTIRQAGARPVKEVRDSPGTLWLRVSLSSQSSRKETHQAICEGIHNVLAAPARYSPLFIYAPNLLPEVYSVLIQPFWHVPAELRIICIRNTDNMIQEATTKLLDSPRGVSRLRYYESSGKPLVVPLRKHKTAYLEK